MRFRFWRFAPPLDHTQSITALNREKETHTRGMRSAFYFSHHCSTPVGLTTRHMDSAVVIINVVICIPFLLQPVSSLWAQDVVITSACSVVSRRSCIGMCDFQLSVIYQINKIISELGCIWFKVVWHIQQPSAEVPAIWGLHMRICWWTRMQEWMVLCNTVRTCQITVGWFVANDGCRLVCIEVGTLTDRTSTKIVELVRIWVARGWMSCRLCHALK